MPVLGNSCNVPMPVYKLGQELEKAKAGCNLDLGLMLQLQSSEEPVLDVPLRMLTDPTQVC